MRLGLAPNAAAAHEAHEHPLADRGRRGRWHLRQRLRLEWLQLHLEPVPVLRRLERVPMLNLERAPMLLRLGCLCLRDKGSLHRKTCRTWLWLL